LANYSKLLEGDDAKRYHTKVALCGGIDPYDVCLKGTETSYELAPKVTREDAIAYLVLSTELHTLNQLKALKGTGGHNFVSSGHIDHTSFLKIPGDKTLVLGKVSINVTNLHIALRTGVRTILS